MNKFLTGVALLLSAMAQAEEAKIDEAQTDGEETAAEARGWICKWCEEDVGKSGELQLGIGYVSEDAIKFGDFRGTDAQGAFLDMQGKYRYRAEGGRYLNLRAEDLGLDSRRIELSGGTQGRYDVALGYKELPHLSGRANTPFIQNGSHLELPATWVAAQNTGSMRDLNASLRPLTLGTRRDTVDAKLAYHLNPTWTLRARVKHERKEGHISLGSTFSYGQTALLPAPIDYETDQVELGFGYTSKKLQSEVGYSGSFFNNSYDNLVWRNPFSHLGQADAYGQLAGAPDNEYHQLHASLGYQLSDKTRVQAYLARGQMRQNQDLLPYTINENIDTSVLAPPSFDGKIATSKAKLALSSRASAQLKWNAEYLYSERDNQSSRYNYRYVITDWVLSGTTETNLIHSFKQHLWKLNGAYSLSGKTTLSAGLDYNTMDRSAQADTDDTTLWTKLSMRPRTDTSLHLEYAYATRGASGSKTATADSNPLGALFYLADRQRHKIGASLAVVPNEKWTLGAAARYYQDDYQDTRVGLTQSEDWNVSLNASYAANDKLSLYANTTWETLHSDLAGNQSGTDWLAQNRYTNQSVGLGAKWLLSAKWTLGADALYADFQGNSEYSNGNDYPEFTTRLWSVKLHGTYQLKENMSLQLAFIHENYDENGLATDNLPTVLGLGQTARDYDVDMAVVSVRYAF